MDVLATLIAAKVVGDETLKRCINYSFFFFKLYPAECDINCCISDGCRWMNGRPDVGGRLITGPSYLLFIGIDEGTYWYQVVDVGN